MTLNQQHAAPTQRAPRRRETTSSPSSSRKNDSHAALANISLKSQIPQSTRHATTVQSSVEQGRKRSAYLPVLHLGCHRWMSFSPPKKQQQQTTPLSCRRATLCWQMESRLQTRGGRSSLYKDGPRAPGIQGVNYSTGLARCIRLNVCI